MCGISPLNCFTWEQEKKTTNQGKATAIQLDSQDGISATVHSNEIESSQLSCLLEPKSTLSNNKQTKRNSHKNSTTQYSPKLNVCMLCSLVSKVTK